MSDRLDTETPSPLGRSLPRSRAQRTVAGQGRFTDDLSLPRMVHAAFLRSPYAHATINGIDAEEARAHPGVVAVLTGADLAERVARFAGRHPLFPDLQAPEQSAMPVERTLWQGEPVAMVIAESRAIAEDAAELIMADLDPLPAVASVEAALAEDAPVLHDAIGGNVGLDMHVGNRQPDQPFADATVELSAVFRFGRHTGVTLEPRVIIADYRSAERRLDVFQSHQCPHQQQDIYARLLGLPEHKVRVVCGDVGGAFGLKQQLYPDELAVCAASRILERPVKFVADRLESFASDTHAREHVVHARVGAKADGTLVGLDLDDRFPIGAYSQYPRSSVGEGSHVLRMSGAPYRLRDYSCRLRMIYQNKPLVGHYRSVGHPIACAVTEAMVDRVAARLGIDPVEIRRRNQLKDADFPYQSPGGFSFRYLSLDACLERLVDLVSYDDLRGEQRALRDRGVFRGLGLATFVELTGTGPGYYGADNARVSAQDGVSLKLEPDGTVRCWTSLTDQGQGIDTGIQQVVAHGIGVAMDAVTVDSGDSATAPYGGGAWASRGAPVGSEAALRASRKLKGNILDIAAALLQTTRDRLDIRGAGIVDETGATRMDLAELATIGYFRQELLPADLQPNLFVTEHFVPRLDPFIITNGIHFSHVEVDAETGFVRLLSHAVVHDAGRLLNPMLADEQIRGGVVQGLGAALFEELIYDAEGQLTNATMADYLVPMAGEMPDIRIAHVETPEPSTELGTRGVGEAGTAGSAAAVLNAINDAISPFGNTIDTLPATPERVLRALGRIG